MDDKKGHADGYPTLSLSTFGLYYKPLFTALYDCWAVILERCSRDTNSFLYFLRSFYGRNCFFLLNCNSFSSLFVYFVSFHVIIYFVLFHLISFCVVFLVSHLLIWLPCACLYGFLWFYLFLFYFFLWLHRTQSEEFDLILVKFSLMLLFTTLFLVFFL